MIDDREIKELEKSVEQIWDVARRFGLDPYPTNFEIVPASVMYEVGSYALPGRYSHWTFGKAYHRMKTMYDFGLSKIYEVVINTNPAYGFLLETNSPVQNKMVIAHVLGHVDFFKNNTYFSKTNRRMVESVTTHSQRIMEYEFKHGRKKVERFLDSVLAIEEHIDPHFFIKRDMIAMVHEEMEYFVPQMQTKIMNEGWASIWHARIMRELDLPDQEHIEFADLHSGVVSPHKGQLNPYYLGYKIYEDIERRWNSPSDEERQKFGRAGDAGSEKIFEVRELENDVSFLRNYLTEGLCEELDLFVFELADEEEWTITEKRWEKVRDQLVRNMTNFGFPYMQVEDGDYDGNSELYLKHSYEGTELDMRYARKALEHVHTLWGRPVHLETIVDEETTVLHYNGDEHEED